MNKLDRLIKELDAARSKDLKTKPVKLSTLYKHYTTTKTKAEQALQDAERINRNAPVISYKIKPVIMEGK